MLRKLERDFLMADLGAVEEMIAFHSADIHSFSYHQFIQRKKSLERQLKEMDVVIESQFEIGVYFGGDPVENEHGITVDFASKLLHHFNALIVQTSEAQRARLFLTIQQRRMMGFVLEACEEDLAAQTHLRALDLLEAGSRQQHPQLDGLICLLKEHQATMQVRCDEREFTVSPR
ncbi:hypothetical protein [Duganella radicis]|uniref:Uncharacterized protein n=1 Tax=Duganella radicis TaxID=551988 RepID=A0A6L6PL13_9BURK|nr:hypothetical protein [Duganella radicis]MTV39652.1 hypothetical protein [Duganella radicis]